MRVFSALLIIVITSLLAGCIGGSSKQVVSIKSLLDEMADHGSLSRSSAPAFQLMQASSWDRAQKTKEDTVGWFGNLDHGYAIRTEKNNGREEYVIMEANGPGAITRWWIPQETLLNHRIVRIYIDGSTEPAVEENYEQLMNGGGQVKWPFAFSSSDEKDAKYQYSLPVGMKQMGAGFYLPIPFAKSCKVTLDDKPFYYIIDYRMYAAETQVQSFSKTAVTESSAAIQSAGEKLLAVKAPDNSAISKHASLKKGQSLEIDFPEGGHVIEAIELKINGKENKQVNRGAVMQISFDGQETVWSPVAEFFGGGVYARPAKNYRMEVTGDGLMRCNWEMPYQKNAKLVLKNYSEETVSADLKVQVKDHQWTPASFYFHADWHEQAPLPAPPKMDWNFIEISGKGKYAGDVLTIYSEPKGWWGEGDEKIYIDEDTFPSHLGTGLEDYYGYAWGMANYFSSPFISTPARDARGKGDWRGYNTVARMRLLDDIPFDKFLKVDVEAWLTQPGVSFSVCTFWYGAPGATDNIKPDEIAVTRQLPSFQPEPLQQLPGESYPDLPSNITIAGSRSGSVQYAGNLLDFLAWRDPSIAKELDGDHDNIIGTDGYRIAQTRILVVAELKEDSASVLPPYVVNFSTAATSNNNANTFLPSPDTIHKSYILSGLIEVKGVAARNGMLSFNIGENAPSSLRIGILTDNASTFDKVGEYLWVSNSRNGSSPKVRLVKSNRVPDWYFFDLTDLRKGDKIIVHGSLKNDEGIFSVGGIVFDVSREP